MTIIGTDVEPLDLSERALELGRWLNGLEELHPYQPLGQPNDGYDRVVRGSIYQRIEAELFAEPSYRWCMRTPGQIKLGAGWDDEEIIGTPVQVDDVVGVIVAVDPDPDSGGWVITFGMGERVTVPRYTVLDIKYLPAAGEGPF